MVNTKVKVLVMMLAVGMVALVSVSIGSAGRVAKPDLPPLTAVAQSDPVFQQRLAQVLRLTDKARAGDKYALKQLEAMEKNSWEFFPKSKIASSAWSVDQLKDNKRLQYWTDESHVGLQSAAAGGLVPYRSPAPAFSRNTLLTRDLGTPIQTEPYICANPEDRDNIIVAATDYGVPYNSMYASFDAGETWRGPQRVPLTPQSEFAADPVLACGRDNKTYHVFMSLGAQSYQLMRYYPVTLTRSDIAVSVSSDGGLTWAQPSIVTTNTAKVLSLQIGNEVYPVVKTDFLDKPWIAVGPDPKNPSKDIVYASFTRFTDYTVILNVFGFIIAIPLQWTSEIVVWSSADNGATWEEVAATEPLPGFSYSDGLLDLTTYRWVQGSQVVVRKDGTVYAAWYDGSKDGGWKGENLLYVIKSSDRGKTWSKPVLAAKVLEIAYVPQTAFFRNGGSSFPQIAIGPQNEVYIVFIARTKDKPTDDGDVYFVRGTEKDGELTFSDPERVNQDKTDKLQFFPAVAVDDLGKLHVMWGDMRDDPAGIKYHIYYTQSEDQGKTWGFVINDIREPDTRVSDFPSNPNRGFPRGRFIGDYFAIAVGAEGEAYLAWSDTRLGEYGGINQKIGFARREAMPAPEIFLTPDRGSVGEQVTVQASNFQPDMVICTQVGGGTDCRGKTNDEGRAEFTTNMPLSTSEGTRSVVVFDESGNRAEASFKYDVGINDLAQAEDVEQLAIQGASATQALEAKTSSLEKTINRVLMGVSALVSLVLLALVSFAVRSWLRRRSK